MAINNFDQSQQRLTFSVIHNEFVKFKVQYIFHFVNFIFITLSICQIVLIVSNLTFIPFVYCVLILRFYLPVE